MFKGNKDPVKFCEDFLKSEIAYNTERNILPSENQVAYRLLKYHVHMKVVYKHLFESLPTEEAVLSVLRGLLSSQAFWSCDNLKEAREDKAKLIRTNQSIAEKAKELAGLMRERDELHNKSGFTSDTHYHVVDVISEAAAHGANNYRYRSYVKEKLEGLACCFDLKYWPSLAEFMDEISRDSREGHTAASDPMTAAGTSSAKSSKADFVRAFLAYLAECYEERGGHLPNRYVPSDAAMADIINSVMNLEADCVVTADYMKSFRQKERRKASVAS
ncbi:hypothetical protein SJR89_13235 [Aeromonas caviae]|jgi:hypothetical protein|uniref:hypothetical protein n=1 Tax=Aeromonas caviae TaxID=648 RepID=UPI0029DC1464|nr:hypothetical protein [Aeromonas caviae]MDX7828051.1 hypothetical protein [Aeromonas caviae]